MKCLFKSFGCATVACFFLFYTLYLMVSTSPTAVEVKPDVKRYIYPVARENLKINFEKLANIFISGDDIKADFTVTELELNAFLDERFPPPDKAPIRTPFIFLRDDTVSVRINISLEDLKNFILNRVKGVEMNSNVRDLTERSEMSFRTTVTVDVGLLWDRKDYPYVYLSGVRVGILPIPAGWLLGGYTKVINDKIREGFDSSLSKAPFIIRSVKIKDGFAEVRIEAKLTEEIIRRQRMRAYYKSDAPLARALDRKMGCKLGCTEEEKEAVKKFMKDVVAGGYQRYDDPKVIREAMGLMGEQ